MNISVVIPVRDRQEDLKKCLESVEQSIRYFLKKNPQAAAEIIVVDDRSSGSLQPVVSCFQNAILIKNNGSGPGAARNAGLLHANGRIIGFIDSDCRASTAWLFNIYEEMNGSEALALQGNPCLFEKNNVYGTCEENLYLGMFQRYINGKTCVQVDTRNCAFRKSILDIYPEGPFIDNMKQAQAEARVAGNRLTKDGIEILYRPNATVYHKDPNGLFNSMKQKFRHGSGRIYVWDRTPPFSHLVSRYFIKPIIKYKTPFWYVIPTHIAFLYGYFKGKAKK